MGRGTACYSLGEISDTAKATRECVRLALNFSGSTARAKRSRVEVTQA